MKYLVTNYDSKADRHLTEETDCPTHAGKIGRQFANQCERNSSVLKYGQFFAVVPTGGTPVRFVNNA